MRKVREAQHKVLVDAMKVAHAREKLESALQELQATVTCLEEIIGGNDDDRPVER